jgi:hypothetical protein
MHKYKMTDTSRKYYHENWYNFKFFPQQKMTSHMLRLWHSWVNMSEEEPVQWGKSRTLYQIIKNASSFTENPEQTDSHNSSVPCGLQSYWHFAQLCLLSGPRYWWDQIGEQ